MPQQTEITQFIFGQPLSREAGGKRRSRDGEYRNRDSGTEGSNPSPSSGESANLRSRFRDDAVRATASKMRRCWLPGSALDESQKVGVELLLMGDRQSAGYK